MNTAPYSMRAIDGSPHVGREAFDAQQRIVDAKRLLDRVDLRAAEQRIRASELVGGCRSVPSSKHASSRMGVWTP